ncbi:biotin/lipoyl attachment domain-containing protein [Staphylothermus marinus F1]|uniref:Biotin/lipoyl attachment domain-containing protein n=1 Tax=Staphylothermus marinus (strain ATCC 43588 / DSM 3639 / JCM 9404 / F1) TaxID=399550 RepID=A3DPF7_STAMF|nr:acetyl-CoA carboxylase biotin carboxyl carrier protein subunit [Staphylothermus marinus]ABN70517.1 biotin/lipoyl attachment domain-containing protein [Staphylothermus marinus F1]
MPRRYRVETYSGDIIVAEIIDSDKQEIIVKLPGLEGEIKARIKKIVDENTILVEIDNKIYRVYMSSDGVLIDDEVSLINRIIELIPIGLKSSYSEKKTTTITRKGEIRAPLSGKVIDIKVKPGDKVSFGDVIALMESMKMVTEIKSDVDGIVEEVLVEKGKAVNKGTLIMRIKPLKNK